MTSDNWNEAKEFILEYGWAIIVVLVAMGALACDFK